MGCPELTPVPSRSVESGSRRENGGGRCRLRRWRQEDASGLSPRPFGFIGSFPPSVGIRQGPPEPRGPEPSESGERHSAHAPRCSLGRPRGHKHESQPSYAVLSVRACVLGVDPGALFEAVGCGRLTNSEWVRAAEIPEWVDAGRVAEPMMRWDAWGDRSVEAAARRDLETPGVDGSRRRVGWTGRANVRGAATQPRDLVAAGDTLGVPAQRRRITNGLRLRPPGGGLRPNRPKGCGGPGNGGVAWHSVGSGIDLDGAGSEPWNVRRHAETLLWRLTASG